MSISTLESTASRRALAELHRYEDQRCDAALSLRDSFLAACAECQADKFATFAPRIRDTRAATGTRMQTIADVLQDGLDHGDFAERAMEVLLKAARGKATQAEAQRLLEAVAARWADMNVDAVL